MIVTTAQLFKHAYGKYAVGAYNINNAEQAMGLFRGCIQSQAPFIIQISKGARKYTDKRMLEAIIRAAAEIFPEAIFAVHLDHGDEETCYDCIKSGFYSSVMIDASHEPYEKNVAITKRVVDAAHAKGLSVEAELGMLGGVEEDIKVEEGNACLTEPGRGRGFRQEDRLRFPRLRDRHKPRRLQVQGPPVPPFRRPQEDPGAPPRLPARDARLLVGAEGRGRPHQRRRRQACRTPWASTRTNTSRPRSSASPR